MWIQNDAIEHYEHSSVALFEALDVMNLRTYITNSRGGSLSEFILDRTGIHSWQDLYDQLVTSQQVSIENNSGFLSTATQEQTKSEISLFDFIDEPKTKENEKSGQSVQGDSSPESHSPLPPQNALERLKTAYLGELADLKDLRARQEGGALYLIHKDRADFYEYYATSLLQQDNGVHQEKYVFEWINEDDKQLIQEAVETAYHEFGDLALTFGAWQTEFEQGYLAEQMPMSKKQFWTRTSLKPKLSRYKLPRS